MILVDARLADKKSNPKNALADDPQNGNSGEDVVFFLSSRHDHYCLQPIRSHQEAYANSDSNCILP